MKDLVGHCCFIQVCFSKIKIMWVKQCHEPSPVITIFIGGGVRRNAHHLPHNLHGVGWGGDVNVPSTAFLRPWTRCLQMLMLRSHGVGWGGVRWRCWRSFNRVPSTFTRCWCYATRSFGLAHDVDATDVDATLTWAGVGWGGDVNVPSRSFGLAQDVDATLRVPSALHTMWMLQMLMLRSHGQGWGGVGMLAFLHAPSTLHKMFMLHYAFPRPCAGCWCYRCWC